MVKEQDKTSKGTPLWMAPEVLLRQGCTEKSDIYSYGIVLWELVTRDSPFKNVQEFQDLVDLVCDNVCFGVLNLLLGYKTTFTR